MSPKGEKLQSNFDDNLGQIFMKENNLTKQIQGTFQHSEISHKKFVILGCYFKRSEIWVLSGLSSLLFISFIGVMIMWWTSIFDNYVLSHFILVNNTAAFTLWKNPPLKCLLKVHIFNYTNVEEYERGIAEKLHVDDVGPFVYEETSQKTNIKIHPNLSISYQEFHSHTFRADLSPNRTEMDRLVVPNLAVLGAAAVNKESSFVTRIAVSTLMTGLRAAPFLNLEAQRFLWGYDDVLFDLAKTLLAFQVKLPYEKFGIIAPRKGLSDNVVTVYSGVDDFGKTGQIERINGEEYMNFWGTEDCNRIKGSDGAAYPVYEIRQKRAVRMYVREICRSIPLVYKTKVKMFNDQVEAYRYSTADTIFDRPEVEPKNKCYCDADTCAPKGIFNMSKCAFGGPASISFPHFYRADPLIQKGVSGLSPNPEAHSSYIDIHPLLGFPMSGTYRLQVNMQVKKSSGMSQLSMFEDDMYLPIAWLEVGINATDLPKDLKDGILKASITLPTIEEVLKYGFLLIALLDSLCITFVLTRTRKCLKRSRQRTIYPQISLVFS